MKQIEMLAMILAGGRGSRLLDLTNHVANSTAMLRRAVCGDLTPRTAVSSFLHPVRRLTQASMFTVEQQMQFLRISISSTPTTRNTFWFSPATTSTR